MNKWKLLYEDCIMPIRGSAYSAGYDLYAHEDVMIEPKQHKLVKTGVACELDQNKYLAIVPRSGLALKKGITVLNTPRNSGPRFFSK